MTNNRLKKAARQRMLETGEKYTTARRRIIEAYEQAHREEQQAPEDDKTLIDNSSVEEDS